MKYEFFFLNNIHDSMEMVNAELDPFLDLSRQGVFDELCMKHIILNLVVWNRNTGRSFCQNRYFLPAK